MKPVRKGVWRDVVVLPRLFKTAGLWLVAVSFSTTGFSYTANQVLFEFLNNGRYRVHVKYTVPALKEFREANVDFARKKEAEKFYFDMIRGADFYYPDPTTRAFVNEPLKAEVW